MKTFKIGGVHPAENKLSATSPIRVAGLPKQAVFSMFQHIGAPARPVVKKGDELGWFLFGGSDFVYLFQKDVQFTLATTGHLLVGEQLGSLTRR